AQTNLILADQQLSNTFSEMLVKKQVADAIFSNDVRIAQLILTNGQQIAGLDLQKGEIQAQADTDIANRQAEAAITGGLVSGGFGVAGGFAQLLIQGGSASAAITDFQS